MSNQLLDIHPRELKFIFELKKQSSCSVRIVNKTDYLVAYKVKTTSPKKYCVRPNVGILKPKSACDFMVTMQGQKAAPLDLICKDKFLVQSTIVPDGTTDEDITSSMFVKDDGKHVEDSKLRVILVSPPHSPELSPKKESRDQMPAHEAIFREVHVFNGIDITSQQKEKNLEDTNLHKRLSIEEITSPVQTNTGGFDINENMTIRNYKDSDSTEPQKEVIDDIVLQKHRISEDMDVWKNDSIGSISMQKDNTMKETTSSTKHDIKDKGLQKHRISENISEWKNDTTGDISVQKESIIAGVIPQTKHKTDNSIPNSEAVGTARKSFLENSVVGGVAAEFGMTKDATDKVLVTDAETLKSKLNDLESKLREAEVTISKLTVERILSSEERESLRKEVVALKSRTVVRKRVQVGFPFLYVVMVAFVSMVLGYRFRC